MIKHYFRIAWRNICNDKLYSLINLVGLTVAFTVAILFIQWIRFELSFENSYPNADRIYMVQEVENRLDGIYKKTNIRNSLNKELVESYPIIEKSISVYQERLPLSFKDREQKMVFTTNTQKDFLKLFPMQVLAGDVNMPGLIINEEIANQIFGNPESAIGAEAAFYKDIVYVTAVIRVPKNSMIQIDVMRFIKEGSGYYGGVHYILLSNNVQFTTEIQKQMSHYLTLKYDSNNKLLFQPIKKIHLHTDEGTEKIYNNKIHYGNIKEIRTFIFIVLLLLALAIVNYVNTSTARAISRSKEAGVRKIIGSSRKELIVRFLIEAFIISFISIFIAFDIAKLLHHPFESVMENTFTFQIDGIIILISLVICVITTALAGSYSAFYLSSLNPVNVLSGNAGKITSKNTLRKILLGFQFAISIGIIICTWTIFRQLNFMLNGDLGFNKEDIYILDSSLMYDSEDFISELQRSPYIINATMASGAPYNVTWDYGGVSWNGAPPDIQELTFAELSCDHRFDETFELQVVQGNFIPLGLKWWGDADEKSFNIVVNETFKDLIGVDNPVGMTIEYGGALKRSGKIIGVLKNFYFKPMNYEVSPLIIAYNPEVTTKMFIKADPKNLNKALEHIRTTYDNMKSDIGLLYARPFMLTSLEREYRQMYKSETRLQKILGIFSLLSIVLSFMGIVSMVAFLIEKRSKAIGIRKINGATKLDIVREFWREFLILIGIATIPSVLISYLLMHNWLQQYVYHPAFGWWIFILVPLFIALFTILLLYLQVRNIAKRNPVESLKSE